MNAYKFETTVQNDGVIQIPELKKLANHKIEIFIVDKSNEEKSSGYKSFKDFSKKWAGFIKDSNLKNYEDKRIEYLEEKYK